MPYKILDNAVFDEKATSLEDRFNDMEAEGFDLIAFTERFTIFHREIQKPKRAYQKKDQKSGTGAATSEVQSGLGSERDLHPLP